ncbi:MAG: hypothetical protein IKO83_06090 [Oscillospiraceae bacterium]|nr:hypothetical protein [Oscillospiraceae bacterium]
MAKIPKVKCRGCGFEFSALRADCPQCGLRRTMGDTAQKVSAPARREGPREAKSSTPQRRSNWQLVIGLLLIAAAVVAVVLMMLAGRSGQAGRPIKPTPTPSPTYEPRPTPTPSPTPTVDNIKIFFLNNEITAEAGGFTMYVGDAPLTISARAYPNDKLSDARFSWRVSDNTKAQLTPSEDTQSCEVLVLASAGGYITLTVECFGVTYSVPLYIWER